MKKRDKALIRLKRSYDYFNEMYFDDKLNCELIFADIKDDGTTQLLSNGMILVKIHKDLKEHPDMAIIILLHEMVHVKLKQENYTDLQDDHGLRFHAEIDRLYREGAYSLLL